MDNTVLFNGGFRILKGYTPFTDYWLVTGPLLDYLNALFFKLLGLTWSAYIFHSSIINLLITLASYYLFQNLKLSKEFSFFYAFQISILFYPVVGTPFVDHHSTFFLVISFYLLILAMKNSNPNFLFFIPLLLVLSFLSKQTPAVYGIFTLSILISILCYFERNIFKKVFKNLFIGSLIGLIFLILFFLFTKIDINNFIQQYIFFASSIGDDRISSYNFNIIEEIKNYKFIYFFIFFLLFLLIKLKKNKALKNKDGFIIIISVVLSLILILHQMITLNQNFIFFTIPFLGAVFHSFFKKELLNKYFLLLAIFVCVFSVAKYHLRFNEERKFNELENIDTTKAVDAILLDKKLKGLKWITYLKPDNPELELRNLREVLRILKNDKENKILITEYQIISPILGIYDNSPNQWHHPSVSFPLKGNKYYEVYKNFFIERIKKDKIKVIYETKKDNNTILELIINSDCFFNNKERVSAMLIKLKINNSCEDLK